MPLPEIREVQNPVHPQRNCRVDQLFGKGIVQLHAENHQVIVRFPQLPIHPVEEVTEVLVVQVIDDDGHNMASAGPQRRSHGISDVPHAVRRVLNQHTGGFRQVGVIAQSPRHRIHGIAAGIGDIF